MRYRRVVLLACLLWATVAVEPAAAQSLNRNLIDDLNYQLLYVALPLTLFVEIILVYAVVRFRGNDDPEPTRDDPALEITWTVATAIILLFVGVSAYSVLASPYISPQQGDAAAVASEGDTAEVEVLAYRWGWEFTYPGANITTQNRLVLPADRDAVLRLTSTDVIHSLFVPDLGVKQDAFPERTTRVRTVAYETGQYRAYCTELCGPGHSRMRATVTVLEPDAYRQWLDEHRGERDVTAVPTPAGGNVSSS